MTKPQLYKSLARLYRINDKLLDKLRRTPSRGGLSEKQEHEFERMLDAIKHLHVYEAKRDGINFLELLGEEDE